MNELVKFAGHLPVSPEDLEAGLKNVSQVIQGSTGGVPFLRLLKSGVYAYGAEKIEPQEGSQWAVNPYSLMHGFACWGDGELLDERMVPFTQAPPAKSELPDLGHPWDQQVAMALQCMNGEDTGITVLYKGTSVGLRNAVKELINSLIAQLQTDKEHCVPVMLLEIDSYEHKKYGEIFYPIFNIVKWISIEDPSAAVKTDDDDGAETEGDDKPEAETSTGAEPDSEPAPRRRRRRAVAKDDDTANDASSPEAKPSGSNRRRRRRQAVS